MALIKCIECGKEFSDKAKACPNCACPIEEIKKINEIEETLKDEIAPEVNLETPANTEVSSKENLENIEDDNEIINKQYSFFNGISKENAKKVKKVGKKLFCILSIICFITLYIILKSQLIACLLVALILAGALTMVVMCSMNIYYYFHKRTFTEIEKKNNKKGFLMFTGILVFSVFFAIFIVGIDGGDNKNTPSDSQLNACRARSGTYFKCSWSTFENRCVCKAR